MITPAWCMHRCLISYTANHASALPSGPVMLTVHALTLLTQSLSTPVHKVAWPGLESTYLTYNIFIPPNHPLLRIACQNLFDDWHGRNGTPSFLFISYSAVCCTDVFSCFFFEDYICFRCGLVRKFAEKKGGYGPWELVNYLFFF